MATSTRIRGNLNPIFTLKAGAAAVASYSDDLKAIGLTTDDKDDSDLTFAEAAAGLSKEFTLALTCLVSFDAGSLFAYLWDNAGATVAVVWGPYGNAVPTVTKPHFTFNAVIDGKPSIELEAKGPSDKSGADVDVELQVIGDVTKLTAAA